MKNNFRATVRTFEIPAPSDDLPASLLTQGDRRRDPSDSARARKCAEHHATRMHLRPKSPFPFRGLAVCKMEGAGAAAKAWPPATPFPDPKPKKPIL